MPTIEMTIKLTYDPDSMHGKSRAEMYDFYRDTLWGWNLGLFITSTGEVIGNVTTTSVKMPFNKKKSKPKRPQPPKRIK